MNKTVTINISGIIFHIEEDAYDSLSRYLSTIKGYFSKTDGGNEIMGDIEARIAELLQSKINSGKQVILMADVDYVMGVMGKPEEFGEEQNKGESENTQSKNDPDFNYGQEKIKRRLFRNPDEKAIGGVCSGLAAYFDIDTVWVRLAMFLLIFFGGLSLWVYIIMWIIIPEAKTTADKFAMRGESANVNNIFQSFKEEAADVKNRMHKTFNEESANAKSRMNQYGRDFRNSNYGETVRSNIAAVLNGIFNVIGRLIGLFLIAIGVVLLIGYLAGVMGISIINSNTNITHWKSVIFASGFDYGLAILAFIIVVGIPVFTLLYSGIKLLFKINYSNRWLNLSLGIIWTLGLILGFYVTIITVKEFNENSKLKEAYVLHNTGDTLRIKLNPAMLNLAELDLDNADDMETNITKHSHDYLIGERKTHLNIIGFAELNVSESNTDSIELVVTKSARGVDKREANENAKLIKYNFKQNGSELVFDEIFTVLTDAKFRKQELDIKLKIPKGKVIYFDESVKYLLNDIDNTTNTWDGDMVGRRWIMTERGLRCIDCKDLDKHEDEETDSDTKNGKVSINDKGIHVKSKEADIKIDENGIKIKTPEENIDLTNDKVKKDKK